MAETLRSKDNSTAYMIDKKIIKTLKFIVEILGKNKISYQISGGLAAILYGAKRNFYDIDIDVKRKDFSKLKRIFSDFITKKPRRFKNNKWDIYVMTLKIKEVPIDITEIDKWKIKTRDGVWLTMEDSLNPIILNRFGLKLKVISKQDLIIYKTLLSRKTDLIDIKQISKKG